MDSEQRLEKDVLKIYSEVKSHRDVCSRKRRWISRNWPETQYFNAPGTVPEEFVRSEDDNNQEILLKLVESSLEKLNAEEREMNVEEFKQMKDLEMLKTLPNVIGSFEMAWVRSLYTALTGQRASTNLRDWLEKEVLKKIAPIFMDEIRDDHIPESLRPLAEALRGFLVREPSTKTQGPSFLEGTPSDSCFEAVRFAMGKLEELSLRCLHCMNDIMLGKGFHIHGRYGNTRQILAQVVRNRMTKILKTAEEDGENLPGVLQRVLRTMGLFSMEIYGNDGGLSNHLDPLPEEMEVLYRKILNAIPELDKLSFYELEEIYGKLSQCSEKRKAMNAHPRVYRDSVKANLQEVLYRCTLETFPDYVVEVLDKILEAGAPRIILRRGKPPKRNITHTGKRETEALLNLSAELRGLSWEYIESSALQLPGEDFGVKKRKFDDDAPTSSSRFSCKKDEDAEIQPSCVRRQTFDFGDEDEVLDVVNREIASVADDGAAAAYMVIGGLMDEFYNRGSRDNISGYLQNGLDELEKGKTELTETQGEEVDILLKIAKRIPTISESVLRNAQLRFAAPLGVDNIDEDVVD